MSVCAISSSFLSTFALRLRRDALDRADLVGEVHRLEHDQAVAHPQAAELLLLVEHVLDDRREPGFLHRAQEEE